MEFDIYTTGGQLFVEDVLNFVSAYMLSSDWNIILQIAITAGVIATSISILFGMGLRNALQLFAIMAVVTNLFFTSKADVRIFDPTQGSLAVRTVDNVPYGIALLAHVTTTTSHFLTRSMEAGLAPPDAVSYQRNGFMFGSTLMAQQARWRAVTSSVNDQLVEFFQSCIVTGVNLQYFSVDEIAGSTDLLATINDIVPPGLAFYDISEKTVVDCPTGWESIRDELTAEIDNVIAAKAASIFQSDGIADATVNPDRLKASLSDFQNWVGMASYSATDTIRQAILINSLDDGIQRFATIAGSDAALTHMSFAIADAQRRTSYSAVGAAALKWVPYLKIVMEVLYYGAFPVAVLLMFTPFAATIFKSYVGGFVWLAAWEPFSAILHSIVLKAASNYYWDAGSVIATDAGDQLAMTWANHFGFIAVEQEIGATAGYLMMSVPFLAFAILFGVRQMTSLATSMLNVGQGASIEAGRTAATGNVSMASAAMNTMRANEWRTSSLRDVGRATSYLGDGTMVTRNRDGSSVYDGGSAVASNSGLNLRLGQSIRSEISERAETARSAARTTASELGSYINKGATQFADFARTASEGTTLGDGRTSGLTRDQRNAVSNAMGTIESAAEEAGVSSQDLLRVALSGNLGLGGKLVGPLSGSIGGSTERNAIGFSNKDFKRAQSASKSADVQAAIATVRSIGEQSSWNASESRGQTANAGDRFNYDTGRRMAETLSSQLRLADSWSEAETRAQAGSIDTQRNLTTAFTEYLASKGYGDDAIGRIVNAKDFAEIQQQQQIIDDLADKLVDQMGIRSPVDPTAGRTGSDYYDPAGIDPDLPATILRMNPGFDARAQARKAGIEAEGAELGASQDVKSGEAAAQYGTNMAAAVEGSRQSTAAAAGEALKSGLTGDNTDAPATGGLTGWFKGWMAGDPSEPVAAPSSASAPPMPAAPLGTMDLDTVTRTVLGEAALEGDVGMQAVALTIRNRQLDPRYPATAGKVAQQHLQYSSWNRDDTGTRPNDRFDPNSAAYQRAQAIVRDVWAGRVNDVTEGATHFFAPELMQQHHQEGKASKPVPYWYKSETADRGAAPIRIGGHIFTGKRKDS